MVDPSDLSLTDTIIEGGIRAHYIDLHIHRLAPSLP